jgi:DNA polymerase I-like protein with 3'-5' exonuclease and polymerase domains
MDFPDLRRFPYLAYDTETTGLDYPTDRVFGFSLATPNNGWDCYYDIRQTPKAVDWLNDQMLMYNGTVISHNASFDYRMSLASGIYLPLEQMDDTVIRACLIDEHLPAYDLDSLAWRYLRARKDKDLYKDLASMFGGLPTRNVQMRRVADAPVDLIGGYARTDARLALGLWQFQEDEIRRQDKDRIKVGLRNIVDFERSLMPTFIRAEMRGIRVDVDAAERAMDALTIQINEAQARLDAIAGWNVNVNSSPQIRKLLDPWQDTGGTWYVGEVPVASTGSGGPSLAAPVLRELGGEEPRLVLDIRSMLKTRDTFLAKHVLEHAHGGRVYPTINQSKGEDGGTGTGRLSYTNPAMQQIPSRNKKVAAIVKPVFLPDEGMVWVDADMDGFEVRVFAHLVKNPAVIRAYEDNPGLDFHQFVADITGLPRNAAYSGQANAKQLNLSMIFNSGNGAIAEKMGMPWGWDTFVGEDGSVVKYKKAGPEAMEVINLYHSRLRGVKDLAEDCKSVAESRGYIHTSLGRRIRFPNGWKTYKASGLLIQSTAADINKENWKIIEEELDGVGHMILNTHDSYSMSMPEDWEPRMNRIKSRIEQPGRLRVPLILDVSGAGPNWWEAVK